MKRTHLFLLVGLAVLIPLAGCSLIPLGNFNGFSKNPMSKVIVVKYPFGYKDPPYITRNGWLTILTMAESCQGQIAPQISSPAETVFIDATGEGLAGASGIGGGSQVFPGAILKKYLWYGGIAGAATGVFYGLSTWSFANVAVTASCTNDFVHKAGYGDIFVYPAYVRALHPGRQKAKKGMATVNPMNRPRSGESSEETHPTMPPPR